MNTTAEQILAALNSEPARGASTFLTPEDTARILYGYANEHEHNMRQPIDAAEVHRFTAAFGTYLIDAGIVHDPELAELIRERRELVEDIPMILWGLQLDEFGYFSQYLNSSAQQALRTKGDLITFDELLRLDPWFVILRKDMDADVPA